MDKNENAPHEDNNQNQPPDNPNPNPNPESAGAAGDQPTQPGAEGAGGASTPSPTPRPADAEQTAGGASATSGPGTTGPVSPSTGLTPNVAAGLSAVFPLVGGIVLLILEKTDAFVRFWAMQSLFFGVAVIAANIIVSITSMIPVLGCFLGGILGIVVWIGSLILWVLAIVKAFQGERWLMPVIGEMVEKQLATTGRPGA